MATPGPRPSERSQGLNPHPQEYWSDSFPLHHKETAPPPPPTQVAFLLMYKLLVYSGMDTLHLTFCRHFLHCATPVGLRLLLPVDKSFPVLSVRDLPFSSLLGLGLSCQV